jgi:hypothetical protein
LYRLDIAFARQGGIKSRQIQELARQLAPFIGAAGLGPEEVAKVFEFAGTAGIAPTEQAYKEYFAKLQAGYTASKATDFGQFMMGLQKGGTAYMAMGGTLEEAISAFASARSVMANEALAATLIEQVTRLSSGGYEKPREAIEKKLGVRWENLAMDERMNALLRYVESIPEAKRGQVLTEQGFPAELTTQVGKMVSPEAKRTMEATRQQVADATAMMIEQQTKAYMESILAEQRKAEAEIAGKAVREGPAYASMLRHLSKARADFDISAAKGQDRWLRDSIEPQVLAIESFIAELDDLYKTAPVEMRPKIKQTTDLLRERLKREIVSSFEPINILSGKSEREIYKLLMNAAKASEAIQNMLDEGTKSSQDLEKVIRNISVPQKPPVSREFEPKLTHQPPITEPKETEGTDLEAESKKYSNKTRKRWEFAREMAQIERYHADEWRSKLKETKEGTERHDRIKGHIEGHEEQVRYYQEQMKWYEKELKETAPFAYPQKKPVDVEAEQQPAEVNLQPVARERFEEQAPVTVVHNHNHYDYGIRFFPRVGSDESGPRIEPGAIA